jgi:hypothetical protein
MAGTRVQVEVEDWIRRHWMPAQLGQSFYRDRVRLCPGGVFDFDAVSADGKTVASISTSNAVTARGKNAVGKQTKIRADMYFLLLAPAERRLVVVTERDMFEWCTKDAERGRVPSSIEFHLAEIPDELRQKLESSRAAASGEVSPQ